MVVTNVTPTANARIGPPMGSVVTPSGSSGTSCTTRLRSQNASNRPNKPDVIAMNRLSARSCLTSCPRVAPSAERMAISEQTVKNHLTAVLDKLGASSRQGAVAVARRQGWLAGPPSEST